MEPLIWLGVIADGSPALGIVPTSESAPEATVGTDAPPQSSHFKILLVKSDLVDSGIRESVAADYRYASSDYHLIMDASAPC